MSDEKLFIFGLLRGFLAFRQVGSQFGIVGQDFMRVDLGKVSER